MKCEYILEVIGDHNSSLMKKKLIYFGVGNIYYTM